MTEKISNTEYQKQYGKKSEHQIQADCVAWFRRTYPNLKLLLFAIPNGAVLSGSPAQRAKQGAKLKREGATPGAADLFLSVPSGDFPGLYIEMKTPKGSQQKNQKEFEAAVVGQGYGYVIPRSLETFKAVVKKYLITGEY